MDSPLDTRINTRALHRESADSSICAESAATPADRGFTLIELLIVVAILGILGGITAFAIGNLTDRAEVTACDAERRTLTLAIESYRATRDAWPTTMTQLVQAGLIDGASDTHELSSTSSGGVIIAVTPRVIAGSACA
jgi:prepilin-type N-terminal cleavage/methylation domain-containing protein